MSYNNNYIKELATNLETANNETWRRFGNSSVVRKAKTQALGRTRRKNVRSKALNIVFRNMMSKPQMPRNRMNMKNTVAKTMHGIGNDARLKKVLENMTSDETTLKMMRNAIAKGNLAGVGATYRSRFIDDVVRGGMMNGSRRGSPKAVAHLISTKNIGIKEFIEAVVKNGITDLGHGRGQYVFPENSEFVLNVFKECEKEKPLHFKTIPLEYVRKMTGFPAFLPVVAYMVHHGAPPVPIEDIFKYINKRSDIEGGFTIDGGVIDIAEKSKREKIPDTTLRHLMNFYSNSNLEDIVSVYQENVRVLLDRIAIPRYALKMFFESFLSSASRFPNPGRYEYAVIPADDIAYLIERGAVITPDVFNIFIKYSKKFQTNPGVIAPAYRLVLSSINAKVLENMPDNANFQNVINQVRRTRGIRNRAMKNIQRMYTVHV